MLLRPLVYVAAPFRAPTTWERSRNAQIAREAAFQLQGMGAATYVPHDNVGLFYEEFDEQIQMTVCYSVLARCHALYTAGRWEHSEGVTQEIDFARQHNIPIFHNIQDKDLIDLLLMRRSCLIYRRERRSRQY